MINTNHFNNKGSKTTSNIHNSDSTHHFNRFQHQHLSDAALLSYTATAAKTEKAATLKLLEYLCEVDQRKLYATLMYGSLFQYVVTELGYSESQAADRVNVMRLMRTCSEVKSHLQTGALNLTTASKIQRHIKTEQKNGEKLTAREQSDLVQACLNQPKTVVEKTLFEAVSVQTRTALADQVKTVASDTIEIRFQARTALQEKLEYLKQLADFPRLEVLFETTLETLIVKEEKKRGVVQGWDLKAQNTERKDAATSAKNTATATCANNASAATCAKNNPKSVAVISAAAPDQKHHSSSQVNINTSTPSDIHQTQKVPADLQLPNLNSHKPRNRTIPAHVKRATIERSKHQCEFTHPETGERCTQKHKLQFDHKIPFAMNGESTLDNIRHLCPAHNQRAAVEWRLM